MLAYFLKINVAIVLFYAFYRLFFYKDTFFAWRRAALLCFFAVSAAYPLLNIQSWITEQEPMVAMVDLYANIVLPEITLTPEQVTSDWKALLLKSADFIYWGVVALLAIRLLIQLSGIIRLVFRCRKIRMGNSNVHLLKQPEGPFSFFHWVFIYPASHTEQELSEILTHEQAHASQWHSIDVLVSELVCALCWFNPFAWLMKREIRTNLEYLADSRVLETGHDSKAYQYHLLGLSHHKAAATIYNSFNVLPLKKRIKMMNKKRTREIGRTKYLMFLPLAALLMIISNIETVARTTKEVAKDVIEAVEENMAVKTHDMEVATEALRTEAPDSQQDKNKQVPQKGKTDKDGNQNPVTNNPDDPIYEVTEVMPEYPEGGMSGFMKFLSKNIIYPEDAKKNGIQGRVMLQFVVNVDGSISNTKLLRGVHPSLDNEAIRVIGTMPNWKPGIHKGKAVRVKYTVPVMFRLSEKNKEEKQSPIRKASETADQGSSATDGETVFEVVDKMPSFPGGTSALLQYISENTKYPVEAQKAKIQGRVVVQMIIDKDGNVTKSKVLQGINPLLDAEAIRVMNNMPKWQPGMHKGKAVNVKYTFPFMFKLQ
ncbi:M56 family metallopeptidase [Bacteroides sp. UBA939]|uniref:M56 family metallopeptidase n=1 Tax=Bacteroides sp. UBA939 TaxID=1946092 RepID=UPI0025C1F74D|nr:M56 family metallopeptidase [Bacteroides sp. UBA939]